MSPLGITRRNITANLLGRGVAFGINLGLIPAYIYFLGMDLYGLVGVYMTFQTVMPVLSMGLHAVVFREMARLSEDPQGNNEMRDLMYAMTWLFWGSALLIGGAVAVSAGWIARDWINTGPVPIATAKEAIMLIGLVLVVQWPEGTYTAALQGLQRQTLLNILISAMGIVRGVGALAVLWLVSPSIQAFLIWQVICRALQTALLMRAAWRALPKGNRRPQFRWSLLRGLQSYSLGMAFITGMKILMSNMDRLLVSKLLDLRQFGYYTVAASVASTLHFFCVAPVHVAVFPRLTVFAEKRDFNLLRAVFHAASQVVTLLLLPLSLVLIAFSEELLQIWTQNPDVAQQAGRVLPWLVAGWLLNGLTYLPYNLPMAFGKPKAAIGLNGLALGVVVAALLILIPDYGMVGAAMAWTLTQLIYAIGIIAVAGRRVPKLALPYCLHDVLLPALAAGAVIWGMRQFKPAGLDLGSTLLYIAGTGLAALAATLLALPVPRQHLRNAITHPQTPTQ
jgi:O-antigen/teichoic acid export membrane protein